MKRRIDTVLNYDYQRFLVLWTVSNNHHKLLRKHDLNISQSVFRWQREFHVIFLPLDCEVVFGNQRWSTILHRGILTTCLLTLLHVAGVSYTSLFRIKATPTWLYIKDLSNRSLSSIRVSDSDTFEATNCVEIKKECNVNSYLYKLHSPVPVYVNLNKK